MQGRLLDRSRPSPCGSFTDSDGKVFTIHIAADCSCTSY
jgi:hypothetical protein